MEQILGSADKVVIGSAHEAVRNRAEISVSKTLVAPSRMKWGKCPAIKAHNKSPSFACDKRPKCMTIRSETAEMQPTRFCRSFQVTLSLTVGATESFFF